MKPTSLGRFILLCIAALTAGCKLAVTVVEGGKVQSEGSGTCIGGSICVTEVMDTNFKEVFVPVPASGWYFHAWNDGDKFFCGGSLDPECSLSFGKHKDNEHLTNLVASSETFYLTPIFKLLEPDNIVFNVHSRTVSVDGREWLHPRELNGWSYNQVNEVCPKSVNRVCTGRLPRKPTGYRGRDLTGFVWASSDDVRLLLQSYRKMGRAITEDFQVEGDPIPPPISAMLSDRTVVTIIFYGTPIIDRISHEELNEKGAAWFWRPVDN